MINRARGWAIVGTFMLLQLVAPVAADPRIGWPDMRVSREFPASHPVPGDPNPTTGPVVASSGTGYLIVWEDDRAGDRDIYASRLASNGRILDGTGIPVAIGAGSQAEPAVTWDGQNYLVVWEHSVPPSQEQVRAARVSLDGEVLDPLPIRIAVEARPRQLSPVAASAGGITLVAWEDDERYERAHIYGARVSQQGEVLDPDGILFSPPSDNVGLPAMATDGSLFLVVWERRPLYVKDVMGSRVGLDGQVLDPEGIRISETSNAEAAPVVAWGSEAFLVAWGLSGFGGDGIAAARVTPDGIVLDPESIRVSAGIDEEASPTVAYAGMNWLVTWRHRRSQESWNLLSARVEDDGTVVDPGGRVISRIDGDELEPMSAQVGAQRVVVSYHRKSPEPPYNGVLRAFFRFVNHRDPP